jgi:hypothetical protein
LPCRTTHNKLLKLKWKAAAAQAPTDSSSDVLLEWMQQQGCSVSGVGLIYEQQQDGSTTRELRATQVRSVTADMTPKQHAHLSEHLWHMLPQLAYSSTPIRVGICVQYSHLHASSGTVL